MRNKELEFQDLISLQKVEISNLLKKKDLLQKQVLEYEKERNDLVIHAHKASAENQKMKTEMDAIHRINRQNGDIAKRCFYAERTIAGYKLTVIVLLVLVLLLIFL